MSTTPERVFTLRFALVVASGLCYFMALGVLLPVVPLFVKHELGGNDIAVGVGGRRLLLGCRDPAAVCRSHRRPRRPSSPHRRRRRDRRLGRPALPAGVGARAARRGAAARRHRGGGVLRRRRVDDHRPRARGAAGGGDQLLVGRRLRRPRLRTAASATCCSTTTTSTGCGSPPRRSPSSPRAIGLCTREACPLGGAAGSRRAATSVDQPAGDRPGHRPVPRPHRPGWLHRVRAAVRQGDRPGATRAECSCSTAA